MTFDKLLFFLGIWVYPTNNNGRHDITEIRISNRIRYHISGVMFSVLAAIAIDHHFESLPGQTQGRIQGGGAPGTRPPPLKFEKI
jgi:hypothetical protein